MNITTDYWAKPIPDRRFDWSAIDDDTYSGEPSDPVGYGATEAEAIADLESQMEAELTCGRCHEVKDAARLRHCRNPACEAHQ